MCKEAWLVTEAINIITCRQSVKKKKHLSQSQLLTQIFKNQYWRTSLFIRDHLKNMYVPNTCAPVRNRSQSEVVVGSLQTHAQAFLQAHAPVGPALHSLRACCLSDPGTCDFRLHVSLIRLLCLPFTYSFEDQLRCLER